MSINDSVGSLPAISADLLLIHAPAFFDFRGRRDIYFPYLSTSGDVPITPLYEYFPLGFKTLQRVLSERGHDVKILNLASLLLKYPELNVDALVRSLHPRLFGIDLNWMMHVQGSLAVAGVLKRVHSEIPVIFGGISATYYAQELIQDPRVDMVMRGYDTHVPMLQLLESLGDEEKLRQVPNLLWKGRSGQVRDNGYGHKPQRFSCGIDWSTLPPPPASRTLPILEVLSTQNAGCSNNCGWCAGSRDAFRRTHNLSRSVIRKPLYEVEFEFRTLRQLPERERYHFYSVGSYTESRSRFDYFLEQVAQAGFKSVSYEQFRLTDEVTLRKMAAANPCTVITLSPESHNQRISKLAGRGNYSCDEMERWIARALDLGICEIDIWYFVGMPEQDERSVMETVQYCARLLKLFKGRNVVPLLCPMIPFLDPGSNFFEAPKRHGYRVFYRSLKDHEQGMERASLIHRINYETKWLNRADLVRVSYQGVRRLTELKAEFGMYPRGVAESVCKKLDEALEFVPVVHEIDSLPNASIRRRELERIGDEILRLDDAIFFSGVANQAFPVPREIGGRWFDEMLWDSASLENLAQSAAA